MQKPWKWNIFWKKKSSLTSLGNKNNNSWTYKWDNLTHVMISHFTMWSHNNSVSEISHNKDSQNNHSLQFQRHVLLRYVTSFFDRSKPGERMRKGDGGFSWTSMTTQLAALLPHSLKQLQQNCWYANIFNNSRWPLSKCLTCHYTEVSVWQIATVAI